MLQLEHSAILLTFIKLPFVTKSFVLSIFEWPFYTDFTVSDLSHLVSFHSGQVSNFCLLVLLRQILRKFNYTRSIIHIFHALTFAGSRGSSLNTRSIGIKQVLMQ